MLSQVVVSRPVLPDTCPSELARICRLAMDPDPHWRYENVEAFRLALMGFLQHAGSRRLAAQAVGARTSCSHAFSKVNTAAVAERIQNLFGECRFAYRQALETWPENDLATAGLDRAVRAMINYGARPA